MLSVLAYPVVCLDKVAMVIRRPDEVVLVVRHSDESSALSPSKLSSSCGIACWKEREFLGSCKLRAEVGEISDSFFKSNLAALIIYLLVRVSSCEKVLLPSKVSRQCIRAPSITLRCAMMLFELMMVALWKSILRSKLRE